MPLSALNHLISRLYSCDSFLTGLPDSDLPLQQSIPNTVATTL